MQSQVVHALRIALFVLCLGCFTYNLLWHLNRVMLSWKQFSKDLSGSELCVSLIFGLILLLYPFLLPPTDYVAKLQCGLLLIVLMGFAMSVPYHGEVKKGERRPHVNECSIGWVTRTLWRSTFYDGTTAIPGARRFNGKRAGLLLAHFKKGKIERYLTGLRSKNPLIKGRLSITAINGCSPMMFDLRTDAIVRKTRLALDNLVGEGFAKTQETLLGLFQDEQYVKVGFDDLHIEPAN